MYLWLCNSAVHARRLLVHERHRLTLLVLALLLNAQVAQSLDVFLLSFKFLLQILISAADVMTLECNRSLGMLTMLTWARPHLPHKNCRCRSCHAYLSLCLGFLFTNGILFSLVDFCLISEVSRMPRFLIQKVVTPGSTQALRIIAWRILTGVFHYFGCFCIRSDACVITHDPTEGWSGTTSTWSHPTAINQALDW